MPQVHKPPVEKTPEDAPIICSICGYPTKKEEVMIAGMLTFVKIPTLQTGRWSLHICGACFQAMEEIDRNGETLAMRKAGFGGTEHV